MIASPRLRRLRLLPLVALCAVCAASVAGASDPPASRCHERPGKIGYLGTSSVYEVEGERGRLRLTSIEPGSPAARAGLEAGDVVVAIDGRALRFGDRFEFAHAARARRPGDLLRYTVQRGEEQRTLRAKLAEPPLGWEQEYVRDLARQETALRAEGDARLQRLSARGPIEISFHRDRWCLLRSEADGRPASLPLTLAAALRVVPLLERLRPGDTLKLEVHASGNALRVEPASLPAYLTRRDVVKAIQDTVRRDHEDD